MFCYCSTNTWFTAKWIDFVSFNEIEELIIRTMIHIAGSP